MRCQIEGSEKNNMANDGNTYFIVLHQSNPRELDASVIYIEHEYHETCSTFSVKSYLTIHGPPTMIFARNFFDIIGCKKKFLYTLT